MSIYLYRMYRSRRLLVLTWAIAVLTVLAFYGTGHPWFTSALLVALIGPALHVMRYPGMWMEAVCLTLSLSMMLVVAQWGGIPVTPSEFVSRVVLTIATGFGVFMLGCAMQAYIFEAGPVLAVSWRVSGKSRLPASKLLPHMHLVEDTEWTVTPTDTEGLFALRITVDVASPEVDMDGEGVVESCSDDYFMKVVTATDTVHEYITFEDADGPVTANRFEVTERKNGCDITMLERAEMPLMLCIGFWLTDHMGDYLMSKIDAAEGRPRRSNRGGVYSQFIVDIARLFPQPKSEGDIYDK